MAWSGNRRRRISARGFKVIDGLKRLALTEVTAPPGGMVIRGDLVLARTLISAGIPRGLRNLPGSGALRGLRRICFAIGHSLTQTQRARRLPERVVLRPKVKKAAERALPTLAGGEKTSQRTQSFV